MCQYFMGILKREAMRNFNAGRMEFTFGGNCNAKILHQHDNEFGVFVHDPVINQDVEIVRIVNGRIAA